MISTAEIASLRNFSTHDDHPVVSLYLDVDGARYPTRADFEAEFSAMAAHQRQEARGQLKLTRDQEAWLDGELARIGEFLALKFKREGARGLVIFSCRPENLWVVDTLQVPVANRLEVNWKPQLATLMETLAGFQRTCVLMTNKETARIFHIYAGQIDERTEVIDSVIKHHAQGGWEQNKLQRRHEKQVREHLKKAAEATFAYFQKEKFDRLAVGISEDLWPELKKVLHPYLKERLLAHFATDINVGANDILARVTRIAAAERQATEAKLLKSLGPELDTGRIYVGGLDDALAMLNAHRVDLLLVENGYAAPGRRCHECNTIIFSERTCPVCLEESGSIANVVEEAREMAVRQGARIISVPPGHPAMAQAGKIAARLRF